MKIRFILPSTQVPRSANLFHRGTIANGANHTPERAQNDCKPDALVTLKYLLSFRAADAIRHPSRCGDPTVSLPKHCRYCAVAMPVNGGIKLRVLRATHVTAPSRFCSSSNRKRSTGCAGSLHIVGESEQVSERRTAVIRRPHRRKHHRFGFVRDRHENNARCR